MTNTKLSRISKPLDYLNALGFSSTGRTLGRGSWGVVDEYVDSQGKKWAVKTLEPNEAAQEQKQHRNLSLEQIFKNESIPFGIAGHNIVPRAVGYNFIIMPVYEQTLGYFLEENKIDLDMGLKFSIEIAHGLGYLHEELKRVHGDLKPDNILLDDFNICHLTDFGSSSYYSLSKRSSSPRDNIGEIQTRAPELFRENSHPTFSSDVYSLGALTGMLLTGKYPGKTISKEYLSKIPEILRPVLIRSLDINPQKRYSDAKKFEEDLIERDKKLYLQKLGVEIAF